MLRRAYKNPLTKTVSVCSISSLEAALRWATFMVKVPDLGGESVKNAKVASIEVKVGDSLPEDTVIAVLESDKSNIDIRNDKSGILKSLNIKEGDVVELGNEVAEMEEQKVDKKKKKKSSSSSEEQSEEKSEEKSSQPEEKSSEKKPEEKKPEKSSSSSSSSSSSAPAPSKPASGSRGTYTKPVTSMRNRIAERLKSSQNENALLTTFNEVDCTDLINMRSKYKDAFEKKHGVKLGLMSPFLKASAHALMEVPVINASWGKGGVIEYRDFVDISVAVATPKGLVVPVMRNVESMSYADIEKSLQHYADKAKANKITADDMAGGTFTVSNGGTFGSWMGTPIVNPPQSAILGMHAIKKKPWVNEKDEIVVRQIMAVALTYDHRLIDGRDAVTFLVKMKNCIEDPARMLLDLA